MPSGDFTQEAYQQLRAAYADSLSTQEDQELEGKEIFGRKMTLETLPVNSPWRGKIKDWQYPDGKTEYQDGKQSPDEILQLMRDSVMERKAAEEPEELSDEELDAILDQILEEGDDEADDDESEEDDDEEEELDAILDDVGDGMKRETRKKMKTRMKMKTKMGKNSTKRKRKLIPKSWQVKLLN